MLKSDTEKNNTGRFKKGQTAWNKGKPMTWSPSRGKGKIPWNKGKKGLQVSSRKGKPYLSIRGEKHWAWKGGITPQNRSLRASLEYKLWREAVFVRDNYTCVWCGVRGGTLHADHIKQFAYYPELRFSIDNGRTLCVTCHKTTITFSRKI